MKASRNKIFIAITTLFLVGLAFCMILFITPDTRASAAPSGTIYQDSNRMYYQFDANLQGYVVTEGLYHDPENGILVIPETFTPAGGETRPVVAIGTNGFAGNNKIFEVVLPSNMLKIGDGAFENCGLLNYVRLGTGIHTIGARAFKNSIQLREINITTSVKTIGRDAFLGTVYGQNMTAEFAIIGDGILYKYNGSASDIVLPSTVRVINQYAFAGNLSLKSIFIPMTVESIGDYAFSGCHNLGSVKFAGGSRLTKVGRDAFVNTLWLNSQTAEFTIIGDGVLIKYFSDKANVIFPYGVKHVADYCFYDNQYILSIEAPATLLTYGDFSFAECKNLVTIKWAESSDLDVSRQFYSIGESCFENCESLGKSTSTNSVGSRVDIPKYIRYIGPNAFRGCYSLLAIYFHGRTNLDGIELGENWMDGQYIGYQDGWVAELHSIVFVPLNGDDDFIYAGVVSGTMINISPVVQREGYAFAGWYYDRAFTNQFIFVDDPRPSSEAPRSILTSSVTLYAKWSRYSAQIIFSDISAPTVEIMDRLNGFVGYEYVLPSAPIRAGYVFLGWQTATNSAIRISDNSRYVIPEKDPLPGRTIVEIHLYALYKIEGTEGLRYDPIISLGNYNLGSNRDVDSVEYNPATRRPQDIIGYEVSMGIATAYQEIVVARFVSQYYPDSTGALVEVVKPVLKVRNFGFADDFNLRFDPANPGVNKMISDGTNSSFTVLPNFINGGPYFRPFSANPSYPQYTQISSNLNGSLMEITLPNTIKVIGEYAFANSENLRYVNFYSASELISIGRYAFDRCDLREFKVPYNTEIIGDGAFRFNYNNAEIKFDSISGTQNKVRYIGSQAFQSNINLKYVLNIPRAIQEIGSQTFMSCIRLQEITFLDVSDTTARSLLNKIGDYAFMNCVTLPSIVLPSSLKTIGNYAFFNCNKLETVTLGANSELTTVGNCAFESCYRLTSFRMPAQNYGGRYVNNGIVPDLSEIGYRAFAFCVSMTHFTFEIGFKITTLKPMVFMECTSLRYSYRGTTQVDFFIPDMVTDIGGDPIYTRALYGMQDTYQAQILNIYNAASTSGYFNLYEEFLLTRKFADWDRETTPWEDSFDWTGGFCEEVELDTSSGHNVLIPNLTKHKLQGDTDHDGCVLDYSHQLQLDGRTFFHCSSLVNFEIPASVRKLRYRSFYYCSSLTTVIAAPYSMLAVSSVSHPTVYGSLFNSSYYDASYIEEAVFAKCHSITTMAVPLDVRPLAWYFSMVSRFSHGVLRQDRQNYPGKAPDNYSGVYYGDAQWSIWVNTTTGYFVACGRQSSCGTRGHGGWGHNYSHRVPTSIVNFYLPNGSMKLCNDALDNIDTITTIKFPETLSWMGQRAMADMDQVVNLLIPAAVEVIEFRAFYHMPNLETVVFAPQSKLGINSDTVGYELFRYSSRIRYLDMPFRWRTLRHLFEQQSAASGGTSYSTWHDNGVFFNDWESWRGEDIHNNTAMSPANMVSLYHNCDATCTEYQDEMTYFISDRNKGHSRNGSLSPHEWSVFHDINMIYRGVQRDGKLSGLNYDALVDIRVTEGVTALPDNCFYDCDNIVRVGLPSTLATIPARAFFNCDKLEFVGVINDTRGQDYTMKAGYTITSLNTQYIPYTTGQGGVLNSLTGYPTQVLSYRKGWINLPSDVVTIRTNSFRHLQKIDTAYISIGVSTIEQYAFTDNINMTQFLVAAANPKFERDNIYALYEKTGSVKTRLIQFPGISAGDANSHHNIPSGVKTIDARAYFNSDYIQRIFVPTTVETIGESAFAHCAQLKEVFVTGCTNTTTTAGVVTCSGANHDPTLGCSRLTSIGANIFKLSLNLETITMPMEYNDFKYYAGVYYRFTGGFWYPLNDDVSNNHRYYSIVPPNTPAIEVYNASSLTKLKTLGLTAGRKIVIAQFAYDLNFLEYLNLPNSTTTIGDKAFFHCDRLVKVHIPALVTSIGYLAFNDCMSMHHFEVSEYNTVYDTDKFYSYTVPISDGVDQTVYGGALYKKTSGVLTDLIQYPAAYPATTYSVALTTRTIAAYAGYNSDRLVKVIVPPSVETMGVYAWADCALMTTFSVENIDRNTGVIVGSKLVLSPANNILTFNYKLTTLLIPSNNRVVNYFDGTNACYAPALGSIGGRVDISYYSTNLPDYRNEFYNSGNWVNPAVDGDSDGDNYERWIVLGPNSGDNALTGILYRNDYSPLVNDRLSVWDNDYRTYTWISDRYLYSYGGTPYTGVPMSLITLVVEAANPSITNYFRVVDDFAIDMQYLYNLYIHENILEVGIRSFKYCRALPALKFISQKYLDINSNYILPEIYPASHPETLQVYVNAGKEVLPNISIFDEESFMHCDHLMTLKWYNYKLLTKIARNAFNSCAAMDGTIWISKNLTHLGDGAFQNCQNIDIVEFEEYSKLAYVGTINYQNKNNNLNTNIFIDCWQLEKIYMPGHIRFLQLFDGLASTLNTEHSGDPTIFPTAKALKKIYFVPSAAVRAAGDTTTIFNIIAANSAKDCQYIEYVYINNLCTEIGADAFNGCIRLEKCDILDKDFVVSGYDPISTAAELIIIGTRSFRGSGLKTFRAPLQVRTINDAAFQLCTSLTNFYFANASGSGSNRMTQIANYTFDSCIKLKYAAGTAPFFVPLSVYEIGSYSFKDCLSLTQFTLPNHGGANNEAYIRTGAFSGCTNLETAYITHVSSEIVGVSTPLNLVIIESYAFYNCVNLQYGIGMDGGDNRFRLPEKLVSIGSYAFYNTPLLKTIHFSASVTSIGSRAFALNTYEPTRAIPVCRTTEVTFAEGSKLTTLGSYVFINRNSITSMTIPTTFALVRYFNSNASSMRIPLSAGESGADGIYYSTTIDGYVDYFGAPKNYPVWIYSMEVPREVYQQASDGVGQVTIDPAFNVDLNVSTAISPVLETLTIVHSYSEGMNTAGTAVLDTNMAADMAFNVQSLKTINLSNYITALGKGAFYNCTNLKTVDFFAAAGQSAYPGMAGSHLKNIGDYAFSRTGHLYQFAMYETDKNPIENKNTKNFGLLFRLKSIGNYAFSESGLHGVYFEAYEIDARCEAHQANPNTPGICTSPGSYGALTDILNYAFFLCGNIKTFYVPKTVTNLGLRFIGRNWSLQEVSVHVCNEHYYTDPIGVLYSTGNVDLLQFPVGRTGLKRLISKDAYISEFGNPQITGSQEVEVYFLPPDLQHVWDWSFEGCSQLEEVFIPKSVKSIGEKVFYSFSGTTSIARFEIERGSMITRVGRSQDPSNQRDLRPATAASNLLTGANRLTTIIIPAGFSVSQFFKIAAGSSQVVYNTDSAAGANLNGLTRPSYNTAAEPYLRFAGNVYYGVPTSLTAVFWTLRCDPSTLTPGDPSITHLANYNIVPNFAMFDIDSVTRIHIDGEIISLGEFAFFNCDSLWDVAYYDGISPTGTALRNYITNIGKYAFFKNTALQTFFFSTDNGRPAGAIGEYAFYGCSVMNAFYMGNNQLVSIGNYAFADCLTLAYAQRSNQAIFFLPASLSTIGIRAFYNTLALSEITIPKNVATIGTEAFSLDKSYTVSGGNYDSTDSLKKFMIEDESKYVASQTPSNILTNRRLLEFVQVGPTILLKNYFDGTIITNANKATNLGGVPMRLATVSVINAYAATGSVLNTAISPDFAKDCTFINTLILRNILSYAGRGYKTIGASAFENCTGLTAVYFNENNVSETRSIWFETIGNAAFKNCTKLEIFPFKRVSDNITIGSEAFYNCYLLTTGNNDANSGTAAGLIWMGYTMQSLGDRAFYNVSGATTVEILQDGYVTRGGNFSLAIGSDVFRGCSSLVTMTIPGEKKLQYYFDTATSNSSSGSIVNIPASLRTINIYSYADYIVDDFANYCSMLTAVNIPMTIGGDTNRPAGITSDIGVRAFSNCTGLVNCNVELNNNIRVIAEYAFNNCYNMTNFAKYASGLNHSFEALRALVNIGQDAFNNAYRMGNFELFSTVENIGIRAFNFGYNNQSTVEYISLGANVQSIGLNAFTGNAKLKGIAVDVLNGSYYSDFAQFVQPLNASSSALFGKNNYGVLMAINAGTPATKTILAYPLGNITNNANTAHYTVPTDVVEIGTNAFNNAKNLKTIDLSNVEVIRSGAFQSSGLTEISFPSTVRIIDSNAFNSIASLKKVRFENTSPLLDENPISALTNNYIGTNVFGSCSNIEEMWVPGQIHLAYLFSSTYASVSSSLKKVYIIDSSTSVVDDFMRVSSLSAFDTGVTTVESLNIGRDVVTVGNNAFKGASALKNVTFNHDTSTTANSVITSIGQSAFEDCVELLSAEWNKLASLQTIGAYAFKNDKKLDNVTIPVTITDIGFQAFYGGSEIKTFVFADGSNYSALTLCGGTIPATGSQILSGTSLSGKLVLPGKFPVSAYFGAASTMFVDADFGIRLNSGNPVDYSNNAVVHGVPSTLKNLYIARGTTNICNGFAFNMTTIQNIYLDSDIGNLDASTVVNIGEAAFYRCLALQHIFIPQSVLTIGERAFASNRDLTGITVSGSNPNFSNLPVPSSSPFRTFSVGEDDVLYNKTGTILIQYPNAKSITAGTYTVQSSVTKIGKFAFRDITSVKILNLPAGLTEVETYAFFTMCDASGTNGLEGIVLPESLITIGDKAFANTVSMKYIMFDNDTDFATVAAASIGNNVFAGCTGISDSGTHTSRFYGDKYPLSHLFGGTVPEGLKTLWFTQNTKDILTSYATGTKITFIVLNERVETIGSRAFADCPVLNTLRYCKDSFTGVKIADPVLSYYLDINTTLKTIKYEAFKNSPEFSFAQFHDRTGTSIDNTYGYKYSNALEVIEYSAFEGTAKGSSTNIRFPVSLRQIGNNAFNGCSSINRVEFPSGTRIARDTGTNAINLSLLGTNIFTGCSSISTMILPGDIAPVYRYFNGTMTAVNSLTPAAFSLSFTADTVNIVDNFLYDGTNGSSKLVSVSIPNTVVSIGANAFRKAINLSTVTFEATSHVASIGANAFAGCVKLTNLRLPDSVTLLGGPIFDNTVNMTEITISGTMKLYEYFGTSVSNIPTTLKTVNVAEGVTNLVAGALYGCTSVTKINLPSTLETLAGNVSCGTGTPTTGFESVFYGMSALQEITVAPSNVYFKIDTSGALVCIATPGASAIRVNELVIFPRNHASGSVILSDSVEYIARYAFSGSKLTTFKAGTGLKEISPKAFENCTALTNFKLTDNVTVATGIFNSTTAFYHATNSGEITMSGKLTVKQLFENNAIPSNLKKIIVAADATNLNHEMLSGCSGITTFELEAGSVLVSVGNNVAANYQGMFKDCTLLTSISGSSTGFESSGQGLYFKAGTLGTGAPKTLLVFAAKTDTYTAPSDLGDIAEDAFIRPTEIKVVRLPSTVSLISLQPLKKLTNLTTLTTSANTRLALYFDTIPTGLIDFTFAEGVTQIASNFFTTTGSFAIKNTTLPSTLEKIVDPIILFKDLSSLEKLAFTAGTGTTVSGNANYFVDLGALYANATAQNGYSLKTLVFYPAKAAVTANKFTIASGCEAIEYNATHGSALRGNTNVKHVVVPLGCTTYTDPFVLLTNLDTLTVPGDKLLKTYFAGTYPTAVKTINVSNGVTTLKYDFLNDCFGVQYLNLYGITEIEATAAGGAAAPGGRQSVQTITADNSLANIRDNAFEGFTVLSSFTTGTGLATIGDNAFLNCSALTTFKAAGETESGVVIPATVSSIGANAFDGAGMTKLTIKGTMTGFGNSAFANCANLTDLIIDVGNVDTISADLFANCNALKKVTIKANNLASINGTFRYLSITDFSFTSVIGASIDADAFNGNTTLARVTLDISGGTASIGANAFKGCTALTTLKTTSETDTGVVIPTSISSIGANAFDGAGMTKLTIKGSMTGFGNNAFANCLNLTDVIINSNTVTSIGAHVFAGCTALRKVTITSNSLGSIDDSFKTLAITDFTLTSQSVTEISSTAFTGNTTLKNVTLTLGTVTSKIAANAFDGCTALQSVVINGTGLNTIEASAFNGCTALTTVTLPTSLTTIGASAFAGCTALTTLKVTGETDTGVVIPASVTSIGANAFDGAGMTKLTIKGSMTGFGNNAFANCTNLTDVIINSNTVTSIGAHVFAGCTALRKVTITSNSLGSIDDSFKTLAITDFTLTSQSVTEISSTAFTGNTTLKNVTLTLGTVTSKIAANAFDGCTALQSVVINGTGLNTIEASAFNGCTALTTVTLPTSLTTIGASAFKGCTALGSITLSSTSLNSIGANAFENCTNLATVTLPATLATIGASAFTNAIKLTNFKVSGESKTGIVIPASVTSIGTNAFSGITAANNTFYINAGTGIGTAILSGSKFTTVYTRGDVRVVDLYGTIPSDLATVGFIDGTTTVNANIFASASGIKTITINSTITTLNGYANMFDPCTSLTSFTITGTSTRFYVNANALYAKAGTMSFTSNTLLRYPLARTDTSFTLATDAVAIDPAAFGTNYTTITTLTLSTGFIPAGNPLSALTSVSNLTCNGNYKLTDYYSTVPASLTRVNIGLSGTKICEEMFLNSSVTTVVITSTVTRIEARAFKNSALNSFGTAVNANTLNLAGVLTILDEAFVGCSGMTLSGLINLTAVYGAPFSGWTPASIIVNGNMPLVNYFGTLPSSLTTVTVSATAGTSIVKDFLYGITTVTTVNLPTSVLTVIGENAFRNMTGLTSITIPTSVTAIEKYAFSGTKLVTVTTYGSIGEHAFSYISTLTTLTIATNGNIGNYAFYNCTSLNTVTFTKCVSIGAFAFAGDMNLATVVFTQTPTTIGESAFEDCVVLPFNFASSVLPSTITSIGANAFKNTALVLLTINHAPTIGNNAFSNISTLRGLHLSAAAAGINKNAFDQNTGLVSVTLPTGWTAEDLGGAAANITGLKWAGPTTFNTASLAGIGAALKEIEFPANASSIDESLFGGLSALTTITVSGSGTYSIEQGALKTTSRVIAYPRALNTTTVTTPNVATIGAKAYNGNTFIQVINIAANVRTIEANAFAGSSGITDVWILNTTATLTTGLDMFGTGGSAAAGKTLHVPVAYLTQYQTAWAGRGFNIVGYT